METFTQKETLFYPIEIKTQKAGESVRIEKALPLLFDQVEGVVLINPGGNHGKGEIQLSIGGEEIFPDGFHARAFMYHQSNHSENEIIAKDLNSYLYPIKEKAKGATIKACYKEPEDGTSGLLYLVFKLIRTQKC